MKRSGGLRSKSYKRTKEQKDYHDRHPRCEICGKPAMPTPHHINPEELRADTEENMFSLCWFHHLSAKGVHKMGIVRFIEFYRLTEHPKWKKAYERRKFRVHGFDSAADSGP